MSRLQLSLKSPPGVLEDREVLERSDPPRAPIVFNRIGPVVDTVCGMEISNRLEVRYVPRGLEDIPVNELLTKGSDFSLRLNAENDDGSVINLSGYTVRGYVKQKYSDTGSLLNLNPTGVLGLYQSGIIDINIQSDITAPLPVTQGIYDVELASGTSVRKLVKGFANIVPEVTTAD